jgi:hypothetical protein
MWIYEMIQASVRSPIREWTPWNSAAGMQAVVAILPISVRSAID